MLPDKIAPDEQTVAKLAQALVSSLKILKVAEQELVDVRRRRRSSSDKHYRMRLIAMSKTKSRMIMTSSSSLRAACASAFSIE